MLNTWKRSLTLRLIVGGDGGLATSRMPLNPFRLKLVRIRQPRHFLFIWGLVFALNLRMSRRIGWKTTSSSFAFEIQLGLNFIVNTLIWQSSFVLQRQVLHSEYLTSIYETIDNIKKSLSAFIDKFVRDKVWNYQEAILFIKFSLWSCQKTIIRNCEPGAWA